MGIINIAEIKEDMVLAADLRIHNDRLLLKKGTRLAPKNLRIMKMWGVVEADIEGVSQQDVGGTRPAEDPLILRAAQDQIIERFAYTDLEHSAMQELLRLCTVRRAEEIIAGGPGECIETKGPVETAEETAAAMALKADQVDPAKLLQGEINLSTLPTIFMHLNDAIKKPNSSAHEIARVISKDTNLSARLLKIVNSAFYSFPNKIDTLSRAVAVVGTNQLSTLALGINIIEVFNSIPRSLIDMKSFWKHSIACGMISRILGSYRNVQNTGRLFVAGLIHDIGRLVMYNYTPINARIALFKAKHEKRLLNETEQEVMNFDHATLGAMLLKKWKLPFSLENIIKYHHSPTMSKDPFEPSIVHLANIVINALGIGSSGERLVPRLDPEAWEFMDLSPNVLSQAIIQLDRQIEETFQFFYADKN